MVATRDCVSTPTASVRSLRFDVGASIASVRFVRLDRLVSKGFDRSVSTVALWRLVPILIVPARPETIGRRSTVRSMEYRRGDRPALDELVALYDSVGWSAYTDDPGSLATAVENSTFLATARADGLLVGLVRAMSDDVSIVYVQDVLVHPAHQRGGVGRRLLDDCLDRFSHVRQRVLLTDDEPRQHRLYRSVGLHDVARLRSPALHAFVDIVGAEMTSQ